MSGGDADALASVATVGSGTPQDAVPGVSGSRSEVQFGSPPHPAAESLPPPPPPLQRRESRRKNEELVHLPPPPAGKIQSSLCVGLDAMRLREGMPPVVPGVEPDDPSSGEMLDSLPNLSTALDAMEKARASRQERGHRHSSASPTRDSGSWSAFDSPRGRGSPMRTDSVNTENWGSRPSSLESANSWGERVSSTSSRQSRQSRRRSSIDDGDVLEATVSIVNMPRSNSVGRGEGESLQPRSWCEEDEDFDHGQPASTAAGAPAPGADEDEDQTSSPRNKMLNELAIASSGRPWRPGTELPASPAGLYMDRRKQNFMMGLQSTNKEALSPGQGSPVLRSQMQAKLASGFPNCAPLSLTGSTAELREATAPP